VEREERRRVTDRVIESGRDGKIKREKESEWKRERKMAREMERRGRRRKGELRN
jgi:hypothetical protein